MAKQLINSITYKLKGEVISADENIIQAQIIKKEVPEVDEIDVQEFINDIVEFCKENMGNMIDLSMVLKVTEE